MLGEHRVGARRPAASPAAARGRRRRTAPRRGHGRSARPGAGRGRSRAARPAPAWPRRGRPRCTCRTRVGRVGERGAGHAEVHGQRDQPLLGAVVQVALDAAALGVGRGDELGPAAGQRLDPLPPAPRRGRGRAGAGPRTCRAAATPRATHGAASSSAAATRTTPTRPAPDRSLGPERREHRRRPADTTSSAAGTAEHQARTW